MPIPTYRHLSGDFETPSFLKIKIKTNEVQASHLKNPNYGPYFFNKIQAIDEMGSWDMLIR